MRPRILLHTCCAPCSTYVIKKLEDDYKVTSYFYNPNIHPKEEYTKRKEEMKAYAERLHIDFVEGEYDIEKWMQITRGLEEEKEGGKRCTICYELRMERTAKFASQKGFDYFATVLSISPYKKADVINQIGRRLSSHFGVNFLEADFKKRDGFKISVKMSKEAELYRQNYCGCIFSKRDGEKEK